MIFLHGGLIAISDVSNELPRRKQRGIIKSIERPKGRGIQPLSASGGLVRLWRI